jgi:hypothetical protein
MMHSHFSGIGESRLLDFNYTLPLKEVITKTPNPKWVPSADAPSASSNDSVSSGIFPFTKTPVMAVPQFYNVSQWESAEMVDSFSPGLNKLGSAKTVPFDLLNQQHLSMFLGLVDTSLHHLLANPAGVNPHSSARNVF